MERYTRKEKDCWTVAPEQLPQALERLARCEDLLQGLEREQAALAGTLETLRGQGKTKTVQFREGMARKLVLGHMKLMLEQYGLVERRR